jgi:hypothetical protein
MVYKVPIEGIQGFEVTNESEFLFWNKMSLYLANQNNFDYP